MLIISLILLLINYYSNAINIEDIGIKFLSETDEYETISANSLFEYGKRHNAVRYFGVAKNEKENFRFDICAPTDDCLTGYGYIEICFLTNTTLPQQKGKCPKYFSSFKVLYFGEKAAFNASEAMNSENTYFRMDGTYKYKYSYRDNEYENRPKNIKFYRKNIRCITAYHEVGWKTNKAEIRFAQPHDSFQTIAYGADPWLSVPFDSEVHPFQTIVILRDSSTICAPSVYVNLPEYIRIETSKPKPPLKTTSTVKPVTTTTPLNNATTLKENVTLINGFIASEDWISMLIAAGFLILLIPQFIIGSIILNKRSSRKSKKLYLMVLEKRENVRKEIQQKQKEALEAEKREKAKKSQKRKQKIAAQMKKESKAKLSKQNKKEKDRIQTPKPSKTGSSRVGKREILPEGVNVRDRTTTSITGVSTKTKNEESKIQLVKEKTDVTSETGSISMKTTVSQKQSFSAKKNKKDV